MSQHIQGAVIRMKKAFSVFMALLLLALIVSPVAKADTSYLVSYTINMTTNLIFSRYDVDVFYDGLPIDSIKDGTKTIKNNFYAEKGQHELCFYNSDNYNIYGRLTFEVAGDTNLSCTISRNRKEVSVSNIKVIKVELTPTQEPETTNSSPSTPNETRALDSSASDDEWICPNCGNTAKSKFCSECGTSRPNETTDAENEETTLSTPEETVFVEPTPTPTPAPTPEPTPIPDRVIKINTEQNTVEVKKQLKLSATVERIAEDAPKKSTLEWTSSDESIAKVSKQGVVTGVSTGKATITCYISDNPGIKCEHNISVIKKTTGVKLSSSSINVAAGYTNTIVATILPEDATDKGITWASSDPSIATVSTGQGNKCTITAKKTGNCTITATTRDGSKKTASVKVHVAPFGVSQSEYTVTSKTGLSIPLQWGSGVTVSLSNKSSALFDADWVNHEVFINPKKAGKGYIELSTDSPKEKIRVNIIIESSAVYDKNSYPYFGYPNILRNPSSYKGRKGHIYGKVLQVTSSWGKTILRVGTSGYFMSDEVFWVECDSSVLQVNVIEDDKITVFGSCTGTQKYTTILGGSITIPSIRAEKIVFGKIK